MLCIWRNAYDQPWYLPRDIVMQVFECGAWENEQVWWDCAVGTGWEVRLVRISAMIYIPMPSTRVPCSVLNCIFAIHGPTPRTSAGFLINKSERFKANLQRDSFHRIWWSPNHHETMSNHSVRDQELALVKLGELYRDQKYACCSPTSRTWTHVGETYRNATGRSYDTIPGIHVLDFQNDLYPPRRLVLANTTP